MSEAAAVAELGIGAGALRPFSDQRLVRRAAEGDERAFAAIYRRYQRDLYRYLLAILGNREDAADALQATMVKTMRALPGERREIALKPWLYRIAHNEAIDLVRRRRRAAADPLGPEIAAREPQPHEEVEQRLRLRRLLDDLDDLPDRQRGALVMRELNGLGFEEIATALHTSPPVVRQTIYEARLSLRQMEAGRGLSCDSVTRALSDADGRVGRRRDLRAHLRECSDCARFKREIKQRKPDFGALAPLPAVAAAAIFKGALGGGASGGAGTAAGGIGGAVGTSVVIKSVATIATVAVLGTAAADRGGLIDLSLPSVGGPTVEAPRSVLPAEAPDVFPGEAGGARGEDGSPVAAPAGSSFGAQETPQSAKGGTAASAQDGAAHGSHHAAGAAAGTVGAHGKPATHPGDSGLPSQADQGQGMADSKKDDAAVDPPGPGGDPPAPPSNPGSPTQPQSLPPLPGAAQGAGGNASVSGTAGQPGGSPASIPAGGSHPGVGPAPGKPAGVGHK